MAKEKKFEKVAEWDVPYYKKRGDYTDKHFLLESIVMMIPIIGQLYWMIVFFASLSGRKVYWKETKLDALQKDGE